MRASFKPLGAPSWSIDENGIVYRGDRINFSEITNVILHNNTSSILINGVIGVTAKGRAYNLAFSYKQKADGEAALRTLREKIGGEQQKSTEAPLSTKQTSANDFEEIKKLKGLLDMGVLTQEEFDTKKKQILGI